MRHIIKAFFIITFFLLFIRVKAQNNYENENQLVNLFTKGRFFEASDFFKKEDSNISFSPFYRLYYKYETAKMLNQSDSAAVFLEKLIVDGDEYWGEHKFYFYNQLLDLYINNLQDYPKALLTSERIRQYLTDNPFDVAQEDIDNGFRLIKEIERYILKKEKYPIIKFIKNDSSDIVKIKDDDNYLFFDGTYNNTKVRTLFDTGSSSFFFMSEVVGDSIGAKRLDIISDKTSLNFNGMELPMEMRIIDSIRIGNTSLYNIPVTVYKFDILSSFEDYSQDINKEQMDELLFFYQSTDIIMGYPAMFLMEKIIINFKDKTFSFPENENYFTTNNNDSEPNLFIFSNALYAGLEFNNIPLSLHVDFGSNKYVQLSLDFYEKHKDKILIKKIKNKKPFKIGMLHKTWQDIPYEIPFNPSLKFNNMIIPNKAENSIKIYSLPNQSVSGAYDGHIGYPFFKSLGKKIVLDFKNMRIDVAE